VILAFDSNVTKCYHGYMDEKIMNFLREPPEVELTQAEGKMIGTALKKWREDRKMTQMELAKKLGLIVDRITIHRWENKGLPPRVNRLILERIYKLFS
jgi:DNA-binding XRE family transcriptional regulator